MMSLLVIFQLLLLIPGFILIWNGKMLFEGLVFWGMCMVVLFNVDLFLLGNMLKGIVGLADNLKKIEENTRKK